jgi:hypothetical protein
MPNDLPSLPEPSSDNEKRARLSRRAALKRIALKSGAFLATAISAQFLAPPPAAATDGSPRPHTVDRNFRRDAYSDYSKYSEYSKYSVYSEYSEYSVYSCYFAYMDICMFGY